MRLSDYVADAINETIELTLKVGDQTLVLDVQPCDKAELTAGRASFITRIKDRTGKVEEKLDDEKLRTFLITKCVVGWKGLTYSAASALLGKIVPNGDRGALATDLLPYTAEDAQYLLSRVHGLEEALWEASMRRVESVEAEELAEKKI